MSFFFQKLSHKTKKKLAKYFFSRVRMVTKFQLIRFSKICFWKSYLTLSNWQKQCILYYFDGKKFTLFYFQIFETYF